MLIIGDLHGQITLLKLLLQNVMDKDVYLVGDIIDRSPRGIETLQYVMEKGFKVVRGNHEQMMLEYLKVRDIGSLRSWGHNGGSFTLPAYESVPEREQKDILDYLERLPYLIYLEELDVLISHAGLIAIKGMNIKELLKMQSDDSFIWLRDEFIDSKAVTTLNTVFIVGHTPTFTIGTNHDPIILRKGNRIFTDCGAVHRGVLGAIEINGNKLTTHYASEGLGYFNEDFGMLRELEISKPKCNQVEIEKNIFNLLGIAGRALKAAGLGGKTKEMSKRVTKCGSYEGGVEVMREYVEFE